MVDGDRNGSISIREFARFRGVTLPRSVQPPVDPAKQEFRRLDINGDGRLELEEIGIATTFSSAAALEEYFARLDRNGDGSVYLEEFRRAQRLDPVRQEFRNLDFDDSGLITIEEIGIATTFSSGEALEAYFKDLDADASGGIDLQEYRDAQAR